MKQFIIIITLILTTFTPLMADTPVPSDNLTPIVETISEKYTEYTDSKAEKCTDENCTIENCDGTKCKNENNCTAITSGIDGNVTISNCDCTKCKDENNCTAITSGIDGNITSSSCDCTKCKDEDNSTAITSEVDDNLTSENNATGITLEIDKTDQMHMTDITDAIDETIASQKCATGKCGAGKCGGK